MNIRELAKLAGVSIATVSRVINNPQLVQPDTREHVLEIMKQVSYSPNWSIESRLSSRSHLIAFLYNESDFFFYSPIQSGLDAIASHRDYTVLFCPLSNQSERRAAQLTALFQQKIDGAIWALRDFHPEEVERIVEKKIPVVLARKYDAEAAQHFNCCYINFTEASFRMTQHLIGLGHRRIALLFENVSQQFMSSFCNGWEQALNQSGIACDRSLILNTPNTVAGGYTKTLEILQSGNLPDAIYCASDELAFGVLRAAHETGVSVPEQLAVAGFTDSPMSNLCDPGLTTIDLPIHRLGIVAARMLFDLIEDAGIDSVPDEVVLQPKLKIRRSCGNQKPINVLFE